QLGPGFVIAPSQVRYDQGLHRPSARDVKKSKILGSPFGLPRQKCVSQVWWDDLTERPMETFVAAPIHEGFGAARHGCAVDRNDDRPLEALRAVNGNDL